MSRPATALIHGNEEHAMTENLEMFFKSDYPRPIDRYIDYFGDTAPDRRRQMTPTVRELHRIHG